MTDHSDDFRDFRDMLDRFGIPYEVDEHKAWIAERCHHAADGVEFTIEGDHESNKTDGCIGFYQTWQFDLDGKFVKCGAWE